MTKALCYAVFGGRGTGKTSWCRREIDRVIRPPRLAVFDFKHDPRLDGIGVAYTDLATMVRAMSAARFKVRYLVDHTKPIDLQFERFCQACWLASQLVMYVPELPEVTKASKAPATWRRCVNVGREYRRHDGSPGWLSIIGDGQRPAEVDKSFIANADVYHCGRLAYENDARLMAQNLNVPFQELQQLPDLHWIERRAGEAASKRGVLTFSGNAAKKSAPAKVPAPAPLRRSPKG